MLLDDEKWKWMHEECVYKKLSAKIFFYFLVPICLLPRSVRVPTRIDAIIGNAEFVCEIVLTGISY
jgi:hypothetical protein